MDKRMGIIFAVFVLLATLLYLRVYYITQNTHILSVANSQGIKHIQIYEDRGDIIDRNGSLLVSTTGEFTVLITCSETREQLKDVISLAIDMTENEIMAAFNIGQPFLVKLSENVSSDDMICFYTPRRYSTLQPATHIIGYLSGGEGAVGIEKDFSDVLRSNTVETNLAMEVDAVGRLIPGRDIDISSTGSSWGKVMLTLDLDIQRAVDKIAAKYLDAGAIIVSEVTTGEILAMSSYPVYDPNNVVAALSLEGAPLINRTLNSYTVGSVFKIVIAAAAIESGMDIADTYYCNGSINISEEEFTCPYHGGHGEMNMIDALRLSCNTYFINLGQQLGYDAIYDMAKSMGVTSSISLSSTIVSETGLLPEKEDVIVPSQLALLSFGQGDLLATPLQINTVTSVIANGGIYVPPTLVRGVSYSGDDLQGIKVLSTQRVMSSNTANILRYMLMGVVSGGTATTAQPSYVTAAGKTGSAQTGIFLEDYEKINSWFSGFFPADDPKFVITVINEQNSEDSYKATEIFKEVADIIYADRSFK